GKISSGIDNGDALGCGEWLASKLQFADDQEIEELLCRIIALWASPHELKSTSSSIEDLVSRINEFVAEDLATALIAACLRVVHVQRSMPTNLTDLAFRLSSQLASTY